MEYVTVYRKVVDRSQGGGRSRSVYRDEPVKMPKRYYVGNYFKIDDISRKVIDEPIEYEFNGGIYTDTPRQLIDNLDAQLYAGNIHALNRVNAIVQAANKKIEEHRAEAMKKAVLEGKTVPVRHSDFKGYLSDAKDIYTRMSARREKLLKDKADAQKEWDKHCTPEEQRKCSELDKTLARAYYEKSKETFNNDWNEFEQNVRQELASIREQMEVHISDLYSAKPEAIDDKTMMLLKSGILKDGELLQLINTYRINPTMLRLIEPYVTERYNKVTSNMKDTGLASKELVSARMMLRTMGEGKAELENYDTFCQWIDGALDQNENKSKTYAMRIDGIYDQLNSSLDNMLVQPVTNTEE